MLRRPHESAGREGPKQDDIDVHAGRGTLANDLTMPLVAREPRGHNFGSLHASSRRRSAPAFSALDQNDKTHTLEDYKGRRVVLYFTPRTTPPAVSLQPPTAWPD